jgi:hypothetical protein
MMKAIFLTLLGLALAISVLFLYGAFRWQVGTSELRRQLEAARLTITPTTYHPHELDGLPPPVQRYFRAALTDGQPMVAAARISHEGQFNMDEAQEKWVPFTSDQMVITRRPGFDWDARIRMAPGMKVCVHDAYVAGRGVLQARLFGLVTVAEQPDTPELAHGELMRFFAEAAWYPTALLPSQGVRWEEIDETSARASLTDGSTAVSLDFYFDAAGLISTVRSAGRYRLVDGEQVATPWQGRFWAYEMRDGMRVPLEGEVEWLLPDGPKPYWRARIMNIAYEFAQ